MKYLATICLYAALFLAGCQSSVDQSPDDGAAEVSGLALAMAEAPAPQVLAVSVKPLAQVEAVVLQLVRLTLRHSPLVSLSLVVAERIRSVKVVLALLLLAVVAWLLLLATLAKAVAIRVFS